MNNETLIKQNVKIVFRYVFTRMFPKLALNPSGSQQINGTLEIV